MNARRLFASLMWGSLAVFGVILPMMIGQDPENALLVSALRAFGCAGFVFGLVAFVRSSGATASSTIPVETVAEVPRTLCNNPLAAGHGALPLADRIDMAAEASSLYDRSFGLVYFDVASYWSVAQSHGRATADATMDFILGMVQMVLRGTDRAELVGQGRFVVCVALLPDQDTLRAVRGRAEAVMNNMSIEALHGGPIEYVSGVAVYPTDGKSGAEIVAHAQRECVAALQARRAAKAQAGPTVEQRRAA